MDWWHFRRSGWALVCICLIVANLKLVKLIYILNQAFRKTGIARTNVGESILNKNKFNFNESFVWNASNDEGNIINLFLSFIYFMETNEYKNIK